MDKELLKSEVSRMLRRAATIDAAANWVATDIFRKLGKLEREQARAVLTENFPALEKRIKESYPQYYS